MTVRQIIEIDEEKCNGCGECVPNCPEGALQVIDGKARLVGEILCDGLGACIGNCPQDAINVTEREAEPYDEKKVMENVLNQGENVVMAHLTHLKEHGKSEYLSQAMEFLRERGSDIPEKFRHKHIQHRHDRGSGCPGSKMMQFESKSSPEDSENNQKSDQPSAIRQWPVQLHLVSPTAPYYQKSDVLLAADCTGYALGNFHSEHLEGKSLAIACPKLDSGREIYLEKLVRMIDEANINTLTVMIMEVPCCTGLLALAKEAVKQSKRNVPVKAIVVSIRGDVKSEEWVSI
mgnify:CR=1 FL=1